MEQVRHLDRIAAKKGVTRNELLRKGADELIAADADDRLSFSGQVEELSPIDARHLIEESKTLHAGLERSQKRQDKREKDQAERDDVLGARIAKLEAEAAAAMEAAGAKVEDQLSARLERFEQSLVGGIEKFGIQLVEDFMDAPQLKAIKKGQEENTAVLTATTAAIDLMKREPRKAIGIFLGNGGMWSTAFIAKWSLCMFALGVMFLGPLGGTFPAIGVPLAHKMMSGDAEFCHLVDYRFGRNDCQVPRAHRVGAAEPGEAQ